MDLQNRVALVTGGAHRVGRAICLALAEAGMRLVVHSHRSTEKAKTTLTELIEQGAEAVGVSADLASIVEAEGLIDKAQAQWGQLDVLVCNAGIWGHTPLGSVTEAHWDALFAVNVRSAFFMAQRAAPYLQRAGGCIIVIADIGIEWSWKGYTPYLASKAALAMLAQNLARDLAPEVRVNSIAPGPVLLPDGWDEEKRMKAARSTLLRRIGNAEDIASAVVYLARADYVTGILLPVDGGQRLR